MMNGQPVGEPTDKVGVIPCSKRVEPGLFFFPGNGSNLFKTGTKVLYVQICSSDSKKTNNYEK